MVRNKSVLVVLVFAICLSFGLLCSASDYSSTQKYRECQRRCHSESRGEREQDRCEETCARRYREEQEEEEEEERDRRRHDLNPEDPQRRYRDCRRDCSQEEQSRQPQCMRSCKRQYETETRLQECQQRCQQQEQRPERLQQCSRECREKYEEPNYVARRGEHEEGRSQSHNPFYFPRRESFEARFEEEHGSFRVLQRFSEKSHVLKDINEFRLAILEANPNAFVLPHHCDAEKIYIVTNGKGTLTFVTQENKESFNLVPGVVVRVPAGSTVYMVNQDNKEKLTIAVLHRPVNNPGHFEAFFPAGPQNPDQSYYRTFSQEIIETVLNTQREQLDRLFEGKQSQQGLFREASQEQVRSLSQEATSPKQKGGEKCALNLLNQSPKYSNQNGRLYEACPREFELLRDVDVSVSASQINQGSIFVPHYNSEATFVVLVTEGNGYVEMVCPHLSSRQSSHREREEEHEEDRRRSSHREREREEEHEEETRSGEYRKITARLSPGDIFVVPAGHPVTWVASKDNELRTMAFGLNFQNSKRIFIAGKNNNVRQWDNEAKELAWGVPARVVDEVFNSPQESYFVSGSQHRQRGSEEGRDNNPLSSILDFARLF